MPATVKTDTVESALTGIETALKGWVEVKEKEYGAIWTVIHACYNARKAGANEEQIRIKLRYSAAEAFPAYSRDSVNTTITGIMKITMGATQAHFKRWKQNGTGYHKAWDEFKKKKKETKSYNATIKDEKADVGDKGNVITTVTTGKGLAASKSGSAKRQPSPGKAAMKQEVAADPTTEWVFAIAKDEKHWENMLVRLAREKVITYSMVAGTINTFVSNNERKADEFVATILSRNEQLFICAQRFIQENPKFPGNNNGSTPKQKRAKKKNTKH